MHSIRRLLVVTGAVVALAACSDRGDRVGEADEPDTPEVAAAPPADADADDTGRNVRDRDEATRTPMDQSNREADVTVTRDIRSAITSDDSMSTDAQNVKIITENGVVTLRGPVEDESERSQIGAIAARTPGVTRVDNQLEIAD
jgi:hypothetical protein